MGRNTKINVEIGNSLVTKFTIFLISNDGKEIIGAGKTLDDGALWGMNYYLEGVTGKVPK